MLKFGTQQTLPTVLLIDDDLVSREVMATVLIMSGYTVHTASDGVASLELLAGGECAPDVILMDTQMPGLSGIRLIEKLRAQSHASLYAISGSHASDELVAASDGFLLKPFAADTLRKLLEDHAAKASLSKPPALAADEPVVQAETLAQLREIMPDSSVRQIYAAVVADLLRRLPMLELAFSTGDTAEVRRIGHAIKGGCGMAGARQAACLGAILESGNFESNIPAKKPPPPKPKSNQLDNIPPVLADLRTATHHLQRMLETEFPA